MVTHPLSRRLVPASVAALAVLALAAGVHAEPEADVDTPAKKQARAHTEQATLDYKLGRFGDALVGYARAYELYPVPPLLFNIGQCHRQLDAPERAVFFFEGYLREYPDAPNRALVIDLIREERQKARAAEQARRRQDELDRQRLEARRRHELRLQRAVEQVIAEQPPILDGLGPRRPAPAAEPVYRRWWFWAATGAAAALGGAAYLELSGDDRPAGLGIIDRR